MDTMSVQEAARYLGVTEKTIYRYLDKRKLSSEKIGLVHFIPRSEVETMALSGHVQTDVQTHERDRVTTLYEITDALDFRVRELEEQVRSLKSVQTPVQTPQEARRVPASVSPSHTTPIRDKATTAPRTTRPMPLADLPLGALTLQEFAEQLGIARRTLLELTTRHNFEHIAIPDPTRPKETKRYFSPEQQANIRQWRAEHATKRP
jgi:excisionase family DNA binding protein